MKIKFNVENLKKAVSDIDQIIKNNPIPITENLLISAESDSIILTVNNLNMKVNKRLPGEVLSAGKGLVHRDDLILLLKMKDDIELEFAGNKCTAKGNRIFSFTVNEKVDDFPLMAEVTEGEPDYAIPEKDLLHCMKLKKFIANPDSARKSFCGMWIDENNILACDGYRLGQIETNYHTSKKFMIPDFVLNYFLKALYIKSSELVVFYISDNKHIKACSDNF
jgi:DNA polymerase III sliding clamp (beta) subunit (PCNA family)